MDMAAATCTGAGAGIITVGTEGVVITTAGAAAIIVVTVTTDTWSLSLLP